MKKIIYSLGAILAGAQLVVIILLVNILNSFSNQTFNITSNFVSEWLTAIATLSATGVALFGIFYTNNAENKRRELERIEDNKQRIEEKRFDKFYDHRNTIVQIEHELIPIRTKMARNLSVLKDAIKNTNPNNTRLILRFDKLNLSTGLNLKLLNLDLINEYSELLSLLETINSDFDYIEQMVTSLQNRNNLSEEQILSLEFTYKTVLPYLLEQCERADCKCLQLLAKCKLTISKDVETELKSYQDKGGEILYNISNEKIKAKGAEIEEGEQITEKDNEPRPKFFSLYLDIKKVPINRQPNV